MRFNGVGLRKCLGRIGRLGIVAACGVGLGQAQVSVLTQHNNNARTGANLSETILTTKNVVPGSFGKLFTRSVDGQLYAQPLYVPNLNIGGKVRNVVIVATMHDSLYAFDADDPAESKPLWKRSFASATATPLDNQYLTGFGDIHPEVGILSTPVIEVSTNTLFCVARVVSGDKNVDANYKQRLYAIDILSGQIRPGSPVLLSAKFPGTGDNADGEGNVTYNPRRQNQRPALAISNGVVYIASASHGDTRPYHGWILGYDTTTMKQVSRWCSTPNGGLGGFWQSGQGPAIDELGNLYLETGNGSWDPTRGNYGDSVVKLTPTASGIGLTDYFTPYNQDGLNNADLDLGVCGPLLLPGTNLLVAGSKEGRLYVLDRSNMGKFRAADDSQVHQWFWGFNGHLHGSPIYWQGGNNRLIYLWSENDHLRSYKFNPTSGLFNTTPFAQSVAMVPDGMPGAFLSVSSDGTKVGTGVVWATMPLSGNANWDIVPGLMRAFNATTLEEIWNSETNSATDKVGSLAKYTPPTVANGKVYVATFSGELAVYGLLPKVAPKAPTGFVADSSEQRVRLKWDSAVGATSYTLYRGLAKTDLAVLKTGIVSLAYDDNAVVAGVRYFYQLRATNAYGDSPLTGMVTGLPYKGSQAITLHPTDDSWVQGPPRGGLNYGTTADIRVEATSVPNTKYTFVKFDLTGVQGPVSTARLRLFGARKSPVSSMDTVYSVSDTSWSETTLNWENKPLFLNPLDQQEISSRTRWYEWDVTAYLNSELAAGHTLVSLAVQGEPPNKDQVPPAGFDRFNSKDATANQPELLMYKRPTIDFGLGFLGATGLTLNGSAGIATERLRLTDGGGTQAGTAFYNTPMVVSSFATRFTFQLTNPEADGMVFMIQNSALAALGPTGGGLGYGPDNGGAGGIGNSVAIKFDLYNNAGEGVNSTGIYVNGASPTVPSTSLDGTGIDLHSGHLFNVAMTYDGTTLTVTIEDDSTHASATQTYTIDVPTTIGSSTAFVGFGGGTGGLTAVQDILSWTFGG